MTREEYRAVTQIQSAEEAKSWLESTRMLFIASIGFYVAMQFAYYGTSASIDDGVVSVIYLFLFFYLLVHCIRLIRRTRDVTSAHIIWYFLFAPVSWLWFYTDLVKPLKIIIGEIEPPAELPKRRVLTSEERKRVSKRFWRTILWTTVISFLALIGVTAVIVLISETQR